MIESVLIRWVAMLAVSLSLGGCAGAARIPEDSFYRLEIAAPTARLPAPALTGMLVVQSGASAPVYRDRALLYSAPAAPGRLQRYHYQYWIDTPPQLVQRSLADYLRAAGVATSVVPPEEGSAARYRLRADIERFEHVRGQGHGNGTVEVTLRVILSERGGATVLMQDSVSAEAAIADSDFPAVADAFERALTDVYAHVVTRLRGLP